MSEFWDWAVAVYARPGVAEACLDLQDRYSQNVPLLLWAIWRGGDDLTAVDTATQWEGEVIGPLRYARRNLKRLRGAEAIREGVKAMELEAERALMTELEGLASGPVDPDALERVVERWGGKPPQADLDHLRALITAA